MISSSTAGHSDRLVRRRAWSVKGWLDKRYEMARTWKQFVKNVTKPFRPGCGCANTWPENGCETSKALVVVSPSGLLGVDSRGHRLVMWT
jgi:hypothetical protein